MPSPHNALVLLPYAYNEAPSQRYRWEQWEAPLKAQGLVLERLHFFTPELSHLQRRRQAGAFIWAFLKHYPVYLRQLWRALKRHDVVIVHRNAVFAGPPVAEWIVHACRKTLIYDFDDAIYLSPPGREQWYRKLLRCEWRVGVLCSMARLVGVGNQFLGKFVKQFHKRYSIWPSTVDMAHYTAKSDYAGTPVIGWTGSESTSVYILALLPTLKALQEKHDFTLLIVGAEIDLAAAGINGVCRPWSAETEVTLVQQMDIGLMPLNDTHWERGKCAFKAIQYQAAGIPAVVSDVGMNREAVRHEKTGLLVPPKGDWIAPLERLLQDSQLRREMGKAAREHIQQHYSMEVIAEKVYRDIMRYCFAETASANG